MACIEKANSNNFLLWNKVSGVLPLSQLQSCGLPLACDNIAILNSFIFTVDTTKAGSASTNFVVPTDSVGTYAARVDWGDGNIETGLNTYNDARWDHTYCSSGIYEISISGTISGWRFNNGGDKLKLSDISQWGDLLLGNSNGYFYGCTNLNISASDIPDTSLITNFSYAWNNCTSLTTFPLLDTSSGTNFYAAWSNCNSLTSFPLIDTSSGTNFYAAWNNCNSLTSFSLIDTSSGTNFYAAWSNCNSLTSFPLIDTSSGTNFNAAWNGCSSLTSFPLLDTSSGTNFNSAWTNCNSLISFPLIDTSIGTNFTACWNTCTSLTSFSTLDFRAMTVGLNCFNGSNIGTASWDAILVATELNNSNSGVSFHGGSAKYTKAVSAAATARDALRDDHSWTIADGGPTT